MDKAQLQEAIAQGMPLAQQYEKLDRKYGSANKPEFISFIILFILLALISSENRMLVGFIYAIVFRVLFAVPILNLVYAGYLKLVGKIFFFTKQRQLLSELKEVLQTFEKTTNLPDTYCNTEILNKFTYYLNHHLADNLKECALRLHDEIKHQEVLDEIDDMRDELRREMKDFNDRTNDSTINRY
ncbi:hypothetical protein OEV98_06385 [Caldibacillus lycopersici]|uniref:Uncharacterized protein n=1 Tax=Perspicuibacillus lycopersici TaxID=1325689 RepID=A0AAE3IRC9_9BACI|nr:hypothetical protein [Perspicuibacillus lycopersici]MCU9613178.1 hypothetical protein [Perspicuibacillus lycopersici]